MIVYSKPNCPYCQKAKALLNNKEVSYNEIIIGKDIEREEFINTFPNVRTVPFITHGDGNHIGGYNELEKYYARSERNEPQAEA